MSGPLVPTGGFTHCTQLDILKILRSNIFGKRKFFDSTQHDLVEFIPASPELMDCHARLKGEIFGASSQRGSSPTRAKPCCRSSRKASPSKPAIASKQRHSKSSELNRHSLHPHCSVVLQLRCSVQNLFELLLTRREDLIKRCLTLKLKMYSL